MPLSGGTRLLVLAILLGLVLAVFASIQRRDMPDRDAGVFLYAGSRLLKGETPYLDVWDHKGPLIYFINALGVVLDPGGERGIWLLEALALMVSGWLCYRALRPSFGLVPAMAGTALLFCGMVLILRPGNYTEEFALPFSMLALFVILRNPKVTPCPFGMVLIGLTLGGALLLRPNLVGIEVAVIVYLLGSLVHRRRFRASFAASGWIALGAAAAIVPFVGFFASRQALPAVWDEYVRFNLDYVREGTVSPIAIITRGMSMLAPAGLPILAVLAWLAAFAGLVFRRLRLQLGPAPIIGLMALPLELALLAVAGRVRTHYFIALLPVLVVLSAWAIHRIIVLVRAKAGPSSFNPKMVIVVVLLAASAFVPARLTMANLWALLRDGPRDTGWIVDELAPYEGDYLLMWGAEAAYNYLSGRPSPTLYVYQYPLYACSYANPEMVNSLRGDIERRRPLIVDTSPTNRRIPPLDPAARQKVVGQVDACALAPEMEALMDGIWETYREAGRLSRTGWIVYQSRY